jgi:transposase
VGAIETAEEFGKRVYVEAWKRGSSRAQKKVVLEDGAERIWNPASQHFPGAIQIVDLFHAHQHLWELVRKLYPNDESTQKRRIRVQQHRLDKGKIERLVLALSSIQTPIPRWPTSFAPRRSTSRPTPSACAIPSSAPSTCSSDRE